MKVLLVLLSLSLSLGCARTWVNYPPETVTDSEGRTTSTARRAIELNGSDSLGATEISVTRDGVKYTSAGGIDNSTSTKAGYHTAEHGITTLGTLGVAGIAGASYVAGQKAATATGIATTKAGVAATKAATALPAAGSTINATVPATIVPIP